MCGIAGFYNFLSGKTPSKENLDAVLDSIRHRGPDNKGIYSRDALVMGNVRLAILGLDESGNQPVYNEDKSIAVVFNGEIYNFPELKANLESGGHKFYTHTDTEVLVHLYEEYGSSMAVKLNGMFAFAIYDTNKSLLLLGRDRTGQKPFYCNITRDGMFFCSELKAMLPFLEEKKLNSSAVLPFLQMGYCPEPHTIIEGVTAVEPGTVIVIKDKQFKSEKYFRPDFRRESERISESEWFEKADEVLRKAVKRHQLSDVPVTVFLSGGIDSSLIAQYLAENGIIKRAYTASFSDSPGFDEYSYASKLAKICGFEPVRVELTKKTLAENMEAFLETTSMPQGDYSGLPMYCLAREVSKDFKVVLGGDGGDELFGGYPTYIYPFLKRSLGWIPPSFLNIAHRTALKICSKNAYMSMPFKLQQLSLAWGKSLPDAHFFVRCFLPPGHESSFFSPDFKQASFAPEKMFSSIFEDAGENANDVDRLCWIDLKTFLGACTVPKAERNCMRFSLENRLPFLDNEMLDLSFRTPLSMKVRRNKTKIGLKGLLRGKLENKVCFNPRKQGFSPPLKMMLDNELSEWRKHALAIDNNIFNRNIAAAIIKLENQGWDLHRLQWNICILLEWITRNGIRT